MYFKRLEMHGFKSFAEPVVMDFHEGVTCIVGPNGSGKSNISDALRWVLGEQSPKALRGGKMEEVIFNGTESRRPRGMAEVTLVIDNSAGILDIEYKEVAITRRMYRSGESEYLINNNPCRLKDIRELIMDTGIGVDGYSIIGQGKIADIVSNKSETRRKIFEEAAGIVAYKTRKAEAERKLAGTRNNLDRIEDIVGEIEGRIGGLEEDSRKAQRYLTLRERYQDLEINITLRNIENAEKRDLQFRDDAAALGQTIGDLEKSKVDTDRELAENNSRSSTLDKISEEAHTGKLAVIEEINSISSQSELNRQTLANYHREEERLHAEIAEAEKKLTTEKSEEERLNQERLKTRIEANEARKRLDEKIDVYQKMTSESTRFTEKMDQGNEKIIDLSGKASSKRSEASSYENFKVTLQERKTNILQEIQELEEALKEDRRTLSEMEDAQAKDRSTGGDLTTRRKETADALQKAQEKEADFRRKIEELKIECGSMESRCRTIEELEQNHEGYNNAVKYIMRMGLKGICGVAGEMMKVPDGYETAIETAMGGAMQNIISEDDDSAKRAITVLKINKVGRLTFLPVTSIKGRTVRPEERVLRDKGFIGMAVDLVQFDERYRNVYEYLLGRVAVVDTLDSAIAMSKYMRNGVRFVTLEGEVINASGAITGGRFKNKSAGLLERRNEIDRMKTQLAEKSEELSSVAATYSEVREQLRQLQEQMDDLRKEAQEHALRQATMREQIISLSNDIDDREDVIAKNKTEIESIDQELSDVDKLIAQMVQESKEAESEIDRITHEMDMLSEEHRETKDAVDNAGDEITEARIEAERAEEKTEGIEELLSRVRESIEDITFQIEDKQEELEELTRAVGELDTNSDDADQRLEELEKKREELDGRLAAVGKEKETLLARAREISEMTAETEQKINALRDQKYQMEIRLAKNETQMENMKERLWTEFEVTYAQALDRRQEDFAVGAATRESREIRKELREIGDVNVGAIEEFRQVSQRYEFLTSQRDDVVKAMQELTAIITDLDRTIIRTFRENFNRVEENFESVFTELFGGGHAELRMENESDPLESGIDIVAQPPGKRLQNINLLSGGEKTMTAIALMFAVLKAKPTPFCILDEVEAALDDENIYKFSHYLQKFSETQFALITHQKATMETADVLYGITMPEHGVSKMLSLRMGDYDPKEYVN
ncbi:MAG: chromosome segregation protein SMC [Eubacterium sp.]|nr:chromosome segregation protein SMC [Eubacterium sp.]